MTEKEAILQRHSVRNYTDRKIEPTAVEKLNSLIDEVNEQGQLHLQLLTDAGGTFNRFFSRIMGLGSAPSVIACIGKDADDLDERIGYYGEKIVLAAQHMGLNTCWAGTFNRDRVPVKLAPDERLSIVIAIGYGETAGKPRRSKKPEQVANVTEQSPEWFKNGVEAALKAPTAINQQHFFIRLSEDETVAFEDLGGVFSKVDLGIVKYHFEVGKQS